MTVAILCTRLNRSKIRINFERKRLITQHVDWVSSTHVVLMYMSSLQTTQS